MKVEEVVRSLISRHPDKFPHREACLNYLLVQSPQKTGFFWNPETGEIDSSNDPWHSQQLNPPEDLEWRCIPFEERMREERKKKYKEWETEIKVQSSNSKNTSDWFLEKKNSWQHKICPFDKMGEDSLAINFPLKNFSGSWQEAIYELFSLLYYKEPDFYHLYQKRLHKYNQHQNLLRLKEELSSYQETGHITSWLMMMSTLEKLDHEWFQRYGLEYFEGNPDRYGKCVQHDKFLEEFYKEKRILPTFDSMVEFMEKRWEKHPCSKVTKGLESINESTQKFRETLWEPWLQNYYQKSPDRGHSSKFRGVTLLIWGCAGRIILTFKYPEITKEYDEHVTLIGTDSKKEIQLGILGINTTAKKAKEMIDLATSIPEVVRMYLGSDTNVRIGF